MVRTKRRRTLNSQETVKGQVHQELARQIDFLPFREHTVPIVGRFILALEEFNKNPSSDTFSAFLLRYFVVPSSRAKYILQVKLTGHLPILDFRPPACCRDQLLQAVLRFLHVCPDPMFQRWIDRLLPELVPTSSAFLFKNFVQTRIDFLSAPLIAELLLWAKEHSPCVPETLMNPPNAAKFGAALSEWIQKALRQVDEAAIEEGITFQGAFLNCAKRKLTVTVAPGDEIGPFPVPPKHHFPFLAKLLAEDSVRRLDESQGREVSADAIEQWGRERKVFELEIKADSATGRSIKKPAHFFSQWASYINNMVAAECGFVRAKDNQQLPIAWQLIRCKGELFSVNTVRPSEVVKIKPSWK